LALQTGFHVQSAPQKFLWHFWGAPGALLRCSWGAPEALLGRFWGAPGIYCNIFCTPEALLEYLSLGLALPKIYFYIYALLYCSWAFLSAPRVLPECSWDSPGALLGILSAPVVFLGSFCTPGLHLGCSWSALLNL